MGEGVCQHALEYVEVQAEQKEQRAQGDSVLHHRRDAAEGFGELTDGQGEGNDIVAQRDIAAELIPVEQQHSARFNLGGVALDGILIESDEGVQAVAVRIDFFLAQADAQPDVAAANNGLVGVVRAHVETQARGGLGQGVAGLVHPVSRRACNANGDVVHTGSSYSSTRKIQGWRSFGKLVPRSRSSPEGPRLGIGDLWKN